MISRFLQSARSSEAASQQSKFRWIWPAYHETAVEANSTIQTYLDAGDRMNTSVPKIIDNAIVGYVTENFVEVEF